MDAELIAHDPVGEPAPAAPEPEPEPAAPPEAALPDDDAALDAEIEKQIVHVSEADKLVPLSAVTGLRGKLKDAKREAARVKELEDQLAQVQSQWQQNAPFVDAAKALLAARQAAPQPQAQPEPVDDTEARELAQTLDLYTPDGQPDVAKAQKMLALVDKRSESKAQQQVAPILQQTAQQQASLMLARAKTTKLPNGDAPDPVILDQLWAHMAQQPNGLQTLTSQQGAVILWNQALGLTLAQRAQQPAKPQVQPPGDPLFTERAGGRDSLAVSLTESDKRTARDLGMTEAEYAKSLAEMPWGKKK